MTNFMQCYNDSIIIVIKLKVEYEFHAVIILMRNVNQRIVSASSQSP